MGLVSLMEDDENGETDNDYEFTMVTAADELLAQMIGKTGYRIDSCQRGIRIV